MKMIAKGKPTFHVIWNLFSCKKLQIFLFPTYLKNPPLARKKNLPNPFLARRENANSWKLFEIGAGQQFVECWESGSAKFNLQFSLNSVPIQSSQWTEIESKYNSTCTMYNVQCTSTNRSTNIWSWWESWRQVCPVLATHLSGLSPEFLRTRIKNSHSLPLPFSCAALWVNLSHSWA